MSRIERILKEAKDYIDHHHVNTKQELTEYCDGILTGLYVAVDYDTYEKLEEELKKYIDEEHDIYIC